MPYECVLKAWHRHESEILNFLRQRTENRTVAEDLLQDVFMKAMGQGPAFCSLENPRAWLFRVTRNRLIDYSRQSKSTTALPDDLALPHSGDRPAIDELDECVGRNLPRLAEADRVVIEACDLNGLSLRAFAEQQGITLPAAKSRLLRARKRLRDLLVRNCQVGFDEMGVVCCHKPREIR